MPYIGIGLHILVAIYFAVHAIRSGQSLYWLILLFSFPLFGSVVYFLAILLSGSVPFARCAQSNPVGEPTHQPGPRPA
ncbi:MAG: putative transrane protein [Stenotrophomonas indicatrix]|jgi:hypothetical protein|uniref:hypothetical protein n=1 Tax=Stenotrophomonas indicatrix TaxID=2045451 RepID=UPI0024319253|nr:hypothetical protein [Stenotrophomonas indicatrix]MDF2480054.1 putative transrane protein [Stenotrophomonas indicatrix]